LIVHPAAHHVRGAFMAPVPFSDAQCEAVFQIRCYVPDQVEAAYNLPALYGRGITGKGRTIVVVDAFGSPTIADDLLQFDQYLGRARRRCVSSRSGTCRLSTPAMAT
jgi:subtilase family serine protease